MTKHSTANIFGVCALLALSAGCSKDALTKNQTDASAPPPADAASKTDGAPDVFVPGEDTRPSDDVVADANPADAGAADSKPAADAGADTWSPDAASEGIPPVDAAHDAPSSDTADAAKETPSACLWLDASVSVGGSVSDGCNTCVCMSGGMMACTARACIVPDGGADLCALSTVVTFGATGGMVSYEDQYQLDPSAGLTITRSYNGRGSSLVDGARLRTCLPTLPACGASSVVSVSTIVADLAVADVQSAFALGTTPTFGVDERPVDGSIWSIALAGGGALLVGEPCPSPTMNSCQPIPAGVQKLADDLKSLAAAMSAQTACAGL